MHNPVEQFLFSRSAHPVYSREGFLNYLFRPSQTDDLMRGGSGKTAERVCNDILDKELRDIENNYNSLAMLKGVLYENTSISLYNEFAGTSFAKNEEKFSNNWWTGTPDIITSDKIIDIKTSENYTTFSKVTEASVLSSYKYQLIAYMDMLGLKKAEIAICCVTSTKDLIAADLIRLFYNLEIGDLLQGYKDLLQETAFDIKLSKDPVFQEASRERVASFHEQIGLHKKPENVQELYFKNLKNLINSHVVDDLPPAARVKIVTLEKPDELGMQKIFDTLQKRREYLHSEFLRYKETFVTFNETKHLDK